MLVRLVILILVIGGSIGIIIVLFLSFCYDWRLLIKKESSLCLWESFGCIRRKERIFSKSLVFLVLLVYVWEIIFRTKIDKGLLFLMFE